MILNPRKSDFRGNLISQFYFSWLDKLLLRGFRKTLTQIDLFPCPKEQCSKRLFERFDKHWQTELKKNNPDIKKSLAKTLYSLFLIGGFFFLIENLLLFTLGIFVGNFSSLCTGENATNQIDNNWRSSLGYALGITIVSIIITMTHSMAFYFVYCVGMQMRAICIIAIFKKILRIQQSVLHKVSVGHIINLVSNDVFKFDYGIRYTNAFWLCPIVILISTIIILVNIRSIGLLGIGYIILHTPIQVVLGFIF
ncbi:Multidrug resistance-associated protein 4-like [Oopsacas minuta]|uniref:Multidrug resistance-associated protein 4-like n=1 Tax=Oopsacas minuta TaxID=111878 RepID=A0AAV7JLL6_9METZ|nr:Multidrug resistance-associated protein 4-like [Oopsacas minuta]